MSHTDEEVLVDNDLVKVVRVEVGGSAKHTAPARGPRVVISLSDEAEARAQHGGGAEEIRRRAGDVVFRDPSPGHTIENTSDDPHTVIIVELKRA
jgi:oxalate decarboxylase/phosphoglucose isomerase-like protein (cupin superfamily)